MSTCALVDVDVHTKEGFSSEDPDEVKRWVEFAHEQEKIAFFDLLRSETIAALRADQ